MEMAPAVEREQPEARDALQLGFEPTGVLKYSYQNGVEADVEISCTPLVP